MADRLERLVNLVIALRETRVPLRAEDIRVRVMGYGQPDPEAFRRMFERDKADLRALGVPIETAPLDRLGDDRQGYRIDPARYDLPAVDLEPDELLALALAVDMTGLADTASSGLRKLEVDAGAPGLTRTGGAGPAGQGSTGRAPMEARLDAPHLEALAEAQLTRTPVRFAYRPVTGALRTRVVDPHALVHRSGHWYLVGHDHERAATRAFRLDRIDGDVRPAGQAGAFPEPAGDVGVDAVVPPVPEGAPPTATVDASPDLAWSVARRARGEGAAAQGGWVRYVVPVGDPAAFVGWVLSHGDELVVREPAALREQVVNALRALADADGVADGAAARVGGG